MEHAIGTRITLEVVESYKCDECFFLYNNCCNASNMRCDKKMRKDGKNIIYKEIKDADNQSGRI